MVTNIPTLLDQLGAEQMPTPEFLDGLEMEPCGTCRGEGLIPMTRGALKVCPTCHGARFVEKKSGVKG